MRTNLIEGRQLLGPSPEYEIRVQHSTLFGLRKWPQIYRGYISWRRYPQGDYADIYLQPWLDSKVQQYNWSKEYAR